MSFFSVGKPCARRSHQGPWLSNLQWSRFRSRFAYVWRVCGAKRTQMFIANYAQKESDRLNLGMRFLALAPARIMPETELGQSLSSVMLAILGFLRRNSSRGWSHGRHQRMLRMRSRNLPATAQPIGKRIHHIRRGDCASRVTHD